MDIGIAIPGCVPGTSGATVVTWAQEAERHGFSTVAALDRLVFDSYEPLTALAAAAAVTRRCGLMTAVLLAPLRSGTALLTKQVATVNRLSGHRLTLGLSVGARPDDYQVAGVPMRGRGARLEAQLDEMGRLWVGDEDRPGLGAGAVPGTPGGPPIILGGHSPAALDRAARRAQGWIAGGTGPDLFAHSMRSFTEAWHRHARKGSPRILALAYFALGADAERLADEYLLHYYRSAGPFTRIVRQSAAVTADGMRSLAKSFEANGCDEVIFVPCSARADQMARAAEIVFS
jgi:alkanesulfonate monooxygenase SsuD/methylene tetrahydromethanopterin reductase-like flavin-dependent oxidoreductase (luciferase family)